MLRKLLILVVLTSSTVALATRIDLYGSRFTHSCGYYSSTEGNFDIRYENEDLPQGTTVTLISGWGGYRYVGNNVQQPFVWEELGTQTAIEVSRGLWITHFNKTLASRSNPRFVQSLQFILAVHLPSGHVFYEKGTNTRLGYYESYVWVSSVSSCINPGEEPPPMISIPFKAVEKN